MIGFFNFVFGRVVMFTFVGLLVLVGGHVFAGGEFSPELFWKLYLGIELALWSCYFVLVVQDSSSFGSTVGSGTGTPIGLDGKPPWAAEEDARLEREEAAKLAHEAKTRAFGRAPHNPAKEYAP